MMPAVPLPDLKDKKTSEPPALSRWEVAGRFFRDADTGETVFVKAVTWGPFPPGEEPDSKTELRRIRDDLGANALRLYELPTPEFLDLCAHFGLRTFLTFPWAQHVDFIADHRLLFEETERFRRVVAAYRGHPSVAGWFVANEIPSTLVRWMGPKKVNRALEKLIQAGRKSDPRALFSYANYPSTEYLCPRGQDFISFNVYLEDRDSYVRYLRRLQQQAGDLPLLITEFGLDSQANSEEQQAEILAWHIKETARSGAAGTTLFAWSDLWFRGGDPITGWDFGLTRRDGSAKPALDRVAATWKDWRSPADALGNIPTLKMSIVICTYRGARLLRPCLESFRTLRYPDFEVILVNDGADPEVASIASDFPEVRTFDLKPHGGLSAARNLGAREATGEIVVYTDDDCEADPDWLTWLAVAFIDPKIAAAGGPNIPPPPTDRIRAMVAAAPGGPAHVLLNDEEAEHVPGCNLAVKRKALEAIGGFDERFRTAGDDVDFCWRLSDAGYRIGFHPAAMVWHHRRFKIKAYLKQQLGYGRAEAMLMPLYPERFGFRGGARWKGRVYLESNAARLATSSARIYHGIRGSAPYQVLYGNGSSHSPSALTLDWMWMAVAAMLVALGGWFSLFITFAFGLAMLATSGLRALFVAGRASIEPKYDGIFARLGVALLTLVQGPLRSFRRFMGIFQVREKNARPSSPPVSKNSEPSAITAAWQQQSFPLRFNHQQMCFWSERGLDRETLLDAFEKTGTDELQLPSISPSPPGADLTFRLNDGRFSHILSVTEYHGGPKCLTRIRMITQESRKSALLLASYLLMVIMGTPLSLFLVFTTNESTSKGPAILGLLGWLLLLFGIIRFRKRIQHRSNLESAIHRTARKLGMDRV